MSSSVLPFSAVRTRVQAAGGALSALRSVKLLDWLRERIRLTHYSRRTEVFRRHHPCDQTFQRAFKPAVQLSEVPSQ